MSRCEMCNGAKGWWTTTPGRIALTNSLWGVWDARFASHVITGWHSAALALMLGRWFLKKYRCQQVFTGALDANRLLIELALVQGSSALYRKLVFTLQLSSLSQIRDCGESTSKIPWLLSMKE